MLLRDLLDVFMRAFLVGYIWPVVKGILPNESRIRCPGDVTERIRMFLKGFWIFYSIFLLTRASACNECKGEHYTNSRV